MKQKPSDHLNRYLELKRREIAKGFQDTDTLEEFNKQFEKYVIANDDSDWWFFIEGSYNPITRSRDEVDLTTEAQAQELQDIFHAYQECKEHEHASEVVKAIDTTIQFVKKMWE